MLATIVVAAHYSEGVVQDGLEGFDLMGDRFAVVVIVVIVLHFLGGGLDCGVCSFIFFTQFQNFQRSCLPRLSASAAAAAATAAAGAGSASLSIASRSAPLNASPCDRNAETWPPGTQRTSAPPPFTSERGPPGGPGPSSPPSPAALAALAAPQCLASSSTADFET